MPIQASLRCPLSAPLMGIVLFPLFASLFGGFEADMQYDQFRDGSHPIRRSCYTNAGRYIELRRSFLIISVRAFIHKFHQQGIRP